jgi:protein SCO1/2
VIEERRIDPRDTPQTAAEKRAGLIASYGRDPEGAGFHFLVGKKGEIDRVANAAGFEYEYDERQGQYGHPAVIMLAKPNGQMARYLYGLEYDPKDLRFGLLEAANGRSTSTIEKVMLYCYRYDPQEGKYVPFARNLMRLGGGITVAILGSFFTLMFVRERKRSRGQYS